jgi:ATPase subunit of ABC transporter with duplicated ATPase domains
VQRDGTVEKEHCRLCERLQAEESFLIRATVTPSGENYKTFLIQKRERRRQEQLEYLKEKERIKTEALKQRQTIRSQNRSEGRVDWGNQGSDYNPFDIGDGYRG